jgi:predicted permease
MLETVVRDARYGMRMLRRTPAFTIAAILTLGLAIGVNTAVFSVVDAVLLKPLPYPEPDRLALASRIVRAQGLESRDPAVDGRTWEAVRDQVDAADRAVFSGWTTGVNLIAPGTGAGLARYVQQQRVGAGFFRTLGVVPQIGREFTAEEDMPGGPPATVLSAGLWRTMFDADSSIVGRAITLRGAAYMVVGIMPDGFQSGVRADLWTPLRPSTRGEGGGENYHIVLRLREGATWAQMEQQLAAVSQTLRRPNAEAEVSYSFEPLQRGMSADLRQPLFVLWSAVGVVLLVACVNLAGLLLARGSQRTREIATRIALGSGRIAVVRQLLIESIVLSALGGAAGLVIGSLTLDALTWLARDAYEIWQPISIDLHSVAVAGALSLAASIVFGLGPAVHAARVNLPGFAYGRAVAGRTRHWSRRAIVLAQVALGVVLLVSAALLLRTFTHLRGLEPGFEPRHLVTASVSLEDARYQSVDRVTHLFETSLSTLSRTPGIENAAVALEVPYRRLLNLGFRHLDGPEAAAGGRMTSATYIAGEFFETMRIPVRRGRTFAESDRQGAPPVAIVSDAFVRMYFGGGDPVGRRIAVAGASREIVGQVGDVQVKPGWGDNGPLSAMPLVYLPAGQLNDAFIRLVHGWFSPAFVIRSAAGTAQTAAAVRRAIDSVDPLLPLARVHAMSDVQQMSLAPQRFLMMLMIGLGGAALLLAAIGIHGLIATSVVERTREIGIRLALGATARQTMRAIAAPGIVLSIAGVAVGLFAAAATARLLQSFVWGVSTSDPLTFGGVALLLLAVSAAASVIPTVRILRLDPATTLRE